MPVALAACHMMLLTNGVDSSHYYIRPLDLDLDCGTSAELVTGIMEDKCGEKPRITDISCKNLIKDADHTRVCVVETEYGYFFLAKDMLDGANIIFNRWD